MGDTKGGPFDITADVAAQMLAAPLNPNGRPNSDVVRPWVNGLDITRRPRDMWIIDFGVDMSEEEAALYEAPFEYVRRHVSPRARHEQPSQRTENVGGFMPSHDLECAAALKPLHRYIATPAVAKHRLFAWLANPTLPDHQLARLRPRRRLLLRRPALPRPRSLGAAHGHVAGRSARYTPTTTFETFPFPWPPGREPADDPRVQAIAAAAADLVAKRDAWLNPPGASDAELKQRTLTNLYNARPTWLDLAHRALDAAVLAAYGWPKDLTDDEILARLLALNLERAGKQRG